MERTLQRKQKIDNEVQKQVSLHVFPGYDRQAPSSFLALSFRLRVKVQMCFGTFSMKVHHDRYLYIQWRFCTLAAKYSV